jgi:hypothetical protein
VPETTKLVSRNQYALQMANGKHLSNSTRDVLHTCPRKFELSKIEAAASEDSSGNDSNIDLIFGKAVGAGIAYYIATKSLDAAIFEVFKTWSIDLFVEKEKAKKNFFLAVAAIQKFATFSDEFLKTKEIAVFNGRPAVELSFLILLPSGYRYYGHIDVILRDIKTGELTIVECKTTGAWSVNPASYQNSDQGLGYSIILDLIAAHYGTYANYIVLYLVYQTVEFEWHPLPFVKRRAARAEFVQSLLYDISALEQYKKTGFFPKRGGSCVTFNRTCRFFGLCHMSNNSFGNKLIENVDDIDLEGEVIEKDLIFDVEKLIQLQEQE